jgi:hypothetical protein
MSNGRVRRSEEEWRVLLAGYRKSGLSVREFCRKQRLQVSSFQRWRTRLNGAGSRSDFVTVIPAAPEASPARPWTVEVTLPDGSRLRFQG